MAPGVRLKAVAFDHVTLDRGGRAEDLYLDQSGGGGPGVVPVPGVDGAGIAPADVGPGAPYAGGGAAVTSAALKSDIGFIPRVDGGRVSGLTVRPQGQGAAFRRLGLRDGDVVTAIGGKPVTGAGDIDQLAAQFPAGGSLNITVERGTATLSIPLTIAQQ